MFSKSQFDAEDRLFSPYSEEAVDHDSLYLALRARRQASSQLQSSKAIDLSKGGLFFPSTSDEEADGGDNSWSGTLLKGMSRVF